MSDNSEDELERLREEKIKELQEQAENQQTEEAQQAAQERAQAQQDALLKQYLTDDARQRLNAVEMSKPDFAETVKQQVTALAQSGRLQGRIDEEQMKAILRELKPESKSFDIRRR